MWRSTASSAHHPTPGTFRPRTAAESATLAGFNGATFPATLEVEAGGPRENGNGRYRDKNVIGKVLRVGDKGYRRLDQPPSMPIERSAPPTAPAGSAAATPDAAPAVAATAIARPHWAQ